MIVTAPPAVPEQSPEGHVRGADLEQGVAFWWSPALPLVQRFGGLGVRSD